MNTVDQCFAALKPHLTAITGATKTAPLTPQQRAGLAVMVAAHFFGNAGAALQEADGRDFVPLKGSREVADLILAVIEQNQTGERQ
jgi:hypothetical protein